MESDAGWSIALAKLREGKRIYYRYEDRRYSINNHVLLNEIEVTQIKVRGAQTTTIQLDLIVNYELENLLLSYIDKIRIVSPIHFKDKVLERVREAMALSRSLPASKSHCADV